MAETACGKPSLLMMNCTLWRISVLTLLKGSSSRAGYLIRTSFFHSRRSLFGGI